MYLHNTTYHHTYYTQYCILPYILQPYIPPPYIPHDRCIYTIHTHNIHFKIDIFIWLFIPYTYYTHISSDIRCNITYYIYYIQISHKYHILYILNITYYTYDVISHTIHTIYRYHILHKDHTYTHTYISSDLLTT